MKKWNSGPIRNEAGVSLDAGTGEGSPAPSATTGSLTAEPTAPAATQTGSWRDSLNLGDDVKGWTGLENIKDPSDAITQLFHAQKFIGAEKMARPSDQWTEDQWSEHYNSLGRPEAGRWLHGAGAI